MAWRDGKWVSIPVEGMLPGDLVSLTAGSGPTAGQKDGVAINTTGGKHGKPPSVVNEIPADMLLMRGTAVVSEASLTGESVPQIKTSLTAEPIDFEDVLDMTGVRHDGSVLLSV